ncbi:MAG: D-glycerate dehydrogenase [Rhodobacteraceae bacterium]|nr:D-glycerate dehydrogenase [Paracoccaceae bacterium]
MKTKPRILISRTLPESVLKRAHTDFDAVVRDSEIPMTAAEAAESMQNNDGVVPTLADEFTAEAFGAVSDMRCRIVANFGAGFNHIDVAAAKARGIVVTNTPGAVTEATADIALSLILMTARRTAEGDRLVRSGRWTGWHPTQMLGQHVTGRTLGIVGMGRIGRAIARRCHFGFGMQIVFANRSRIDDPGVPARQLAGIESVFAEADIVAIAVSSGPESHHLIGREQLRHLKPHAILVNVSRGDILDEGALVELLQSGAIAGAGLDVYEFEPKVPSDLLSMENVVLLPHLGTSVLEVREGMGAMALDNLTTFFAGMEPPNPVN